MTLEDWRASAEARRKTWFFLGGLGIAVAWLMSPSLVRTVAVLGVVAAVAFLAAPRLRKVWQNLPEERRARVKRLPEEGMAWLEGLRRPPREQAKPET